MGHRLLYLSSTTPLLSLAAFISFSLSQISPFVYGKTFLYPSSSSPINRDLYHTSDDLMKQIKALAYRHPDKLSFNTFRIANKGYHAKLAVVTYSRSARKDFKSKIRSFGQHGRELITSELALHILYILSEEQPLPHKDTFSLNATLDKLVIKIVPIENMNGRKLVEAGKLCERRNGRGVDLNRNWSVDWGKKEKDYDPYEESPGAAPFSEPETQMMRKLSISFDPHIWINVHSGMEALFMPYDHKNKTPDGLPSQKLKLLLEEMNSLHCHNRCMVGSGGGSVGYLAHGTATDFMYDIVRVPMAFTFEIYGDEAASSKDCFKMFNPVNPVNFSRVVNDWSATFFAIFTMGAQVLDGEKMVALKSEEIIEVGRGGMQEISSYSRLFLFSLILFLFFFCSRVSRTKPIILGP